MGVSAGEIGHLLRIFPCRTAPGVVLPIPHGDLSQPRFQLQGQPLGQIEGFGGGLGAEQVAGVDRVYGGVGEALLQRLDLPVPIVVMRLSYWPWMRR